MYSLDFKSYINLSVTAKAFDGVKQFSFASSLVIKAHILISLTSVSELVFVDKLFAATLSIFSKCYRVF